jgi:LysM repeat protein
MGGILAGLAWIAYGNRTPRLETSYTPSVAHTATATATAYQTPEPPRTYRVVAGDGWYAIASKNGVSVDALLAANHATVDTAIHPDDVVLLPSGSAAPAPQPTYVAARPAYTVPVYAAPAPQPTYATAPAYSPPVYAAPQPVNVAPGCAENGSCYGDISPTTGRPKTVQVDGYYRKGTYVRGHYRSK